jgi:Niemann-Pick C1 protein
VQEFFDTNDKYFGRGYDFTVYANGLDFFANQAQLEELDDYMDSQNFLVDGSTTNWFAEFSIGRTNSADKASFWSSLHEWYSNTARHQPSIKWRSPDCDAPSSPACTAAKQQEGIVHSKVITSTLIKFASGKDRYEVYYTMRTDIKDMFGDSTGQKVFPYAMDFLYWEEVGIIDSELIRNLIIAFAIICMIIALLIPEPRVFAVVALNIVAAIVEVIGLSHFWGVTMNGVSTIYFLICAGLAVDYSAHIAHTFKNSEGSSEDRALNALTRIGPSVFHAVFSTLLAVIVLAFSKSFVFVVFFKILFLLSIVAGAHGLWLLPTLLGIFGGSSKSSDGSQAEQVADAQKVAKDAGA